jgi:hypothetical protein
MPALFSKNFRMHNKNVTKSMAKKNFSKLKKRLLNLPSLKLTKERKEKRDGEREEQRAHKTKPTLRLLF